MASRGSPNTAVHQATFGILDAEGGGAAAIAVPAGTDPALAGVMLNHAYVVFASDLAVTFTSNAVALTFEP